jgi:kynureninase
VESQIRYHQLIPDDTLITLKPRDGEIILRIEDILEMIKKEGSSIALILLGGIQYYSGQFFQMEEIVRAAHGKVSCYG